MSDISLTMTSQTGGAPSRGWGGRLARALAYMLIAVGALALIDAGVTLVWQEPITALYALLRQDRLGGDLRAIERAAPTPLERRALASLPDERRRVAYLARRLERDSRPGGAVGRIVIPRIGADYVVVRGTGTEELQSGPGDLLRHVVSRHPRHDRDRRAPDDVSGALPRHRPAALRKPHPAEHALRALHLHRYRPARGLAERRVRRRLARRLHAAWCSRPAHRCSAPPNGCSCMRA